MNYTERMFRSTNFSSQNLDGADFSDSILLNVSFKHASMKDVKLHNTVISQDTTMPDGRTWREYSRNHTPERLRDRLSRIFHDRDKVAKFVRKHIRHPEVWLSLYRSNQLRNPFLLKAFDHMGVSP